MVSDKPSTAAYCEGNYAREVPRWLHNWVTLKGWVIHQSMNNRGDFYICPKADPKYLHMESTHGFIHCNKRVSRERFMADWGEAHG